MAAGQIRADVQGPGLGSRQHQFPQRLFIVQASRRKRDAQATVTSIDLDYFRSLPIKDVSRIGFKGFDPGPRYQEEITLPGQSNHPIFMACHSVVRHEFDVPMVLQQQHRAFLITGADMVSKYRGVV